MIDDPVLPVVGLVAGFFLFAVAFQAWAAKQDARAERALAPPPVAPVVGVAAVHPLPDVTPRRLVWDSYHRTHVVEEARRD